MNEKFRTYLEEAIGSENALVAFSAFEKPASVSVRMNPFKKGASFDGQSVRWNPLGVILESRPVFTLDPFFHAGAYYVQDSSSMFVGNVFRRVLSGMDLPAGRPLRVLDLCAAPGGKTTDIAASLRQRCGDGFVLVANEVMKARVGTLADNVALWGDPNVVVTSDDPSAFASLDSYFDIIVADVPCSGEGMFRKDEQAQQQWSADNVALCEARQRRIVADVWPSLSSGGVFIYSTCTFNRYENDDNVQWISRELGGRIMRNDIDCEGVIKTQHGYSLVPGFVEGEGQYCASLIKDGEGYAPKVSAADVRRTKPVSVPAEARQMVCGSMEFRMKGDVLVALPAEICSDVDMLRGCLHVIAAGCAVGTLKGSVLVPDADMALSLAFNREVFPVAEVDLRTALLFLRKDAIMLPQMPKGYVTVSYGGLPLGFVKNLGNRSNNLHPQGRRIRMNIPQDIK